MDEKQIRSLIDKLNAASDAYYNGQDDVMSNYEWDAGFDVIKAWEDETGIIYPDSPTQRVSEDNIPGQKEAHEYPALSLAKTKEVSELVRWADGRTVWMSLKLDGSTLVASYNNGRLEKLLTRGDGATGTNITHIASAIRGIPQRISEHGKLVVRGEVLMTLQDFQDFTETSEEEYKNARNLAAGTLTLKDLDEIRRRKLQWIAFTLVHIDSKPDGYDMDRWGDRMDYLKKLGFITVPTERCDPSEIPVCVEKWTQRVENGEIPYPVDGLVIAYDDVVYASGGSVTGHHATRSGFAFKWQDKPADTVLKHIEWSCAATAITPVAVFEPVELEGTTVKRASLHNISECKRLGIGGPGTKLKVIKANMIIPMIIEAEQKGALDIPGDCPACGSMVEIRLAPSGAETMHCPNPECPAKQVKLFSRFVSKDGLDIDGMSEQTVKQFIAAGFIHSYPDVFALSGYADMIKEMDGFGALSVSNLTAAIERSRDVSASKFLYALGIPMCGHDVCRKLSGKYTVSELYEYASSAASIGNTDAFADIDGIGPEKSSAVIRWFSSEKNRDIFRELQKLLRIADEEKKDTGKRCEGYQFVITGNVSFFKNRSELKEYIESEGGRCTETVTSKTNFLINNDITSQSGKNRKAAELGIPVIAENEFIERFGAPERNSQ